MKLFLLSKPGQVCANLIPNRFQARLYPSLVGLVWGLWLWAGLTLSVALAVTAPPSPSPADAVIERQAFGLTLADGITTKAELDYPPTQNGPLPAVLFLGGSGATDMDGATPATPGIKPYREMTDNLVRQGFVVLRYNKRGLDTGGRIANQRVSDGRTNAVLVEDGLTALRRLAVAPNVDSTRLFLVAHSQGTLIAAQVAQQAKGEVRGLVLTGTIADWSVAFDYQLVDFYLELADQVDTNQDGVLTPDELTTALNADPTVYANRRRDLIFGLDYFQATNRTGQPPTVGCDSPLDLNHDCRFSIQNELKPALQKTRQKLLTSPALWRASGESGQALQSLLDGPNLADVLLPLSLPVLFQHGQDDERAPSGPVKVVAERLRAAGIPTDFKLYPALTHSLVPDEIVTALALKKPLPAQILPSFVLNDQAAWLLKLAAGGPGSRQAIPPLPTVATPVVAASPDTRLTLPDAGLGYRSPPDPTLGIVLVLLLVAIAGLSGVGWLRRAR